MKEPDIDLVYLWVDGSDPKWQAKRNAFIGNTDESSSVNCKGRYVNNDELKYSLRSVEKYAPWIRKIFVITDNQTPDWIDLDNPQVKIIDLEDIMPKEILPCFNSGVIEKFLYKIPGLSEHFLYANDDMFINKPVSPDTFFAADGFPIIRLTRKPFRKIRWFWRTKIRRKPLQNYSFTIANASKLVKKQYGIYYTGMPHHNIDTYLKSDCRRVREQIFREKFEVEQRSRMRSPNDIQRLVFSYVALAEKRGHLFYVSEEESIHVQIHNNRHYKKLAKYNPTFFCLNDSQFAQDTDRMRARSLLDNYFPEKSRFEK